MNNQFSILICTAVMMEAKAIAKRLKLRKTDSLRWSLGDVALLNVGIRAGRLGEIDRAKLPQVLIMAGLAGGLDPQLKVADVVAQAKESVAKQLSGFSVAIAEESLATVDEILTSPEEKAKLRKKTKCAAVDMETAIASQFAMERGIAFMAIRAISDSADETLDPKIAALVDSDGRPRAGKITAALIKRPALMKELSRLKRSADAACSALADKVAEAVSQWLNILATK